MKFEDIRKQARLSIEQAAVKLGRKKETLYKYEKSFRLPSIDILIKMSNVYKCDKTTVLVAYEFHKEEYKQKLGRKM